MESIASPNCSLPSPDPQINNVVASNWSILEQTPPPSLLEILGAYNSKGEGDRDMLLALLNAKSAEDQRIASIAALQRAMLELNTSSSLSPREVLVTSTLPVRKRPRASLSPPHGDGAVHDRDHDVRPSSSQEQPPPSPYSWSSNESATYSPRSRVSMKIGSLLSSRPEREGDNGLYSNGMPTVKKITEERSSRDS